jgi:hypothetical protein
VDQGAMQFPRQRSLAGLSLATSRYAVHVAPLLPLRTNGCRRNRHRTAGTSRLARSGAHQQRIRLSRSPPPVVPRSWQTSNALADPFALRVRDDFLHSEGDRFRHAASGRGKGRSMDVRTVPAPGSLTVGFYHYFDPQGRAIRRAATRTRRWMCWSGKRPKERQRARGIRERTVPRRSLILGVADPGDWALLLHGRSGSQPPHGGPDSPANIRLYPREPDAA